MAGAPSPTRESELPLVQTDPYSSSEKTAQRYNVSYPHRQAELLVFPRRSGAPLEAERVAWSSLWELVKATVIRFDGAVPMYHVQLPRDAVLEQVADRLLREGHELIESIEANSCVFPQQGGTLDADAGGQWGHWKIGLEEAWKITTGKSSVVVAVMDSGINHQNPDLACNFWDNPCDVPNGGDDACPADGRIDDIHGWNFWDGNDQLFDNAHHGTLIAGIVGACANQIGVVGINWSTSLMDLRVYDTVAGTGALDAVLSAIPYAVENGAHVINASWTTAASPELEAEIKSAASVIVTTSAGDVPGGTGNELLPPNTAYPCNWTTLPLPNLICVTSSTSEDEKAKTANYGAAVQIAAPGFEILSTQGTSTGEKSGTSFAAPYVAGVVALLRAEFPLATTSEIVTRVVSGDDVPALGDMTQMGSAPGTGRRLNACRALSCDSLAPPPP